MGICLEGAVPDFDQARFYLDIFLLAIPLRKQADYILPGTGLFHFAGKLQYVTDTSHTTHAIPLAALMRQFISFHVDIRAARTN
jgi:hypothetical protein